MPDKFSYNIPNDILSLYNIFSSHGFELKLVGGAVRDLLRNRCVSDFDLATSASPEQMLALFRDNKNYFLIPTGLAHGTITVVYEKKHYEITSYRIDGNYSDKRRPDTVSFTTSLEKDLSRRDFTVNAIAVDPMTKEIFDPFHGRNDISNKIIKTVGCPSERFSEDALRMLRACRFASVLGYTIDPETFLAMTKLSHYIQQVSQERIRDEIIKILSGPKPSVGIELMKTCGLLGFILPELEEGIDVSQNEFHKFDVYTHNLETCNHMKSKLYTSRLAALLHDIGKPRAKKFAVKIGNGNVFYNHEIIGAKMTKQIMHRLKFSNEDINFTVLLVEMHMFYYTNEWSNGAVRRFLQKFDGNLFFLQELFLLRQADRLGSGTKKNYPHILSEFRTRINDIMSVDAALKVKDLKINGNTIMNKFSLTPGPVIGKILNHLLELVLDSPELNSEEKLLIKADEYIKHSL
ncbi:MAG: CCA tRNA nucleotidyltransferase [Brevinemataceae bacterium]